MTNQQEREANARARAFIDRILKINESHDMGGRVSDEQYRAAVAGAVSTVRPLVDRH